MRSPLSVATAIVTIKGLRFCSDRILEYSPSTEKTYPAKSRGIRHKSLAPPPRSLQYLVQGKKRRKRRWAVLISETLNFPLLSSHSREDNCLPRPPPSAYPDIHLGILLFHPKWMITPCSLLGPREKKPPASPPRFSRR